VSDPVRLVIFDCDGVLVDSERITVRIDVAMLAQLGWALTEAEVLERFLGRTDEYMASQIEAHLGRPLAANWDEPFQRLYREAFEADLKPVPGILEALDEIVIPACVASSGTHERMRYTLGASSAPATSSGASRRPISSSTRRIAWACTLQTVPSSKTAATESRPRARPACVPSVMPAG
jgi:hypothetical protein